MANWIQSSIVEHVKIVVDPFVPSASRDLAPRDVRRRDAAGADREPAARIDHHVERMTEHLSLDSSQAAEVRAVMEATNEEMQAAREAMKAVVETLKAAREAGDEKGLKRALQSAESARDNMRDVHDASRAEVESVLTLEQRAMLFEMDMKKHQREREMKERVREHRAHQRAT